MLRGEKSEKVRTRNKRGKKGRMYVPEGQERVVRGDPGLERVGVRGRKRYHGRRTSAVITWGDFLGPPTGRGPIPGQIRSLWENAKRSAHITQIPALLLVYTHNYNLLMCVCAT